MSQMDASLMPDLALMLDAQGRLYCEECFPASQYE